MGWLQWTTPFGAEHPINFLQLSFRCTKSQ